VTAAAVATAVVLAAECMELFIQSTMPSYCLSIYWDNFYMS
jgi:hypothetical protein